MAVIIDNLTNRTRVMKTGSLVTTSATADQVILTYTVSTGKTFYLQYFNVMVRLTTYATTATNYGTSSLEIGTGTKVFTRLNAHAGILNDMPIILAEPLPIPSGTVIRIVCTPSATTSFTWQGNFGGYEKINNQES